MKKKTMAWLLTLVMLLGMTPAFAAEDEVPFTAKAGDTELTEITLTADGYAPYAWNGEDMAPAAPVDVYTVELPEGTTEVALSFDENRLVYNYAEGATYLAGEYEDPFTGADTATVAVDSNEDGYADYIQVQTPYDEDWNSTTLYAIVFTMEGLKAPLPFTGIAGKWYCDAAVFVAENDLMDGDGDGADTSAFNGDAIAPRGVVIEALWRMAGKPAAETSTGFVDVEAQDPHHAAIDWAVEQGIVTGFEDGTIRADESVTREQLAALLYRYVDKVLNKGFSGTKKLELDVADWDSVSAWAQESVCWVYENKVMTGREGGKFTPQGTTTRAELAAMLMKFAAVE